jgi:hypothetical protein
VIFTCFLPWRSTCRLRWKGQKCYHHVADATGTHFLYVGDRQSCHVSWQSPQPSSGLRWRIARQWHLYCVATVCTIKTLTLICR